MKDYNDNKLDQIIAEAERQDEKLSPKLKKAIFESIDSASGRDSYPEKRNGLRVVIASAAVFVLLAVMLFAVKTVLSDKQNENNEKTAVTDNEKTNATGQENTEATITTISEPVHFISEKYEWFDASKDKIWLYGNKQSEEMYVEFVMDLDDKCYSLQMGESSSHEDSCWVGACWVGTNFSEKEKGHNTLFYDQNRKLYVYADFYQMAQRMGADCDDELRVFFADRYVEIAEFAKDFSSYLSEGIIMAADDLRAGKHYVFHEENVKFGTRYFGYQIFRGDLSEEIAADTDSSAYRYDITAVSLFDDRLRKKMKVYCNRSNVLLKARMFYIPDFLKEDESYDAYFVSE